jgi:heat shock protein HtpX
MASGPSLVGRAILAIALLVGFYLLALGIIAVLLAIPIIEAMATNGISIRLALLCLFGAGVVAWSILPRFDKFVPPGPRLTPQQHPRLFAEIEDVAKATGQEVPAEVYLDPTVNAWVAQRGGLMGFGSRRVMGLGLPLMAVLSVPQLRAVMAHEFGHFYGGDTKLGPWVYKTRAAVIRTVINLAKTGRRLLHAVFLGYCKMFLRITHAISRRQELAADALAVRVAGARAHADALTTIHRAALGFNSYIGSELDPVLAAGYLPPVAAGFSQFLSASPVAQAIDKAVTAELKEAKHDPYDTHPPLSDRLAAIGDVGEAAEPPGSRTPALSLLNDVPQMEKTLLASMVKGSLKPLDWGSVGAAVYVPLWTRALKDRGGMPKGVKATDLPALVADPAAFVQRIGAAKGPAEQRYREASGTVGASVALALHRLGWTVEADLGAEIRLRMGDAAIEPFRVVPQLADKTLTADAWQRTCDEAGLSQLDLGAI